MKTVSAAPRLRLRPEVVEPVVVNLPVGVIDTLNRVAAKREMSSLPALIRFYITQGLRDDLAEFFYEQVLNEAKTVLARYNLRPDEIEAIIEELRVSPLDDTEDHSHE